MLLLLFFFIRGYVIIIIIIIQYPIPCLVNPATSYIPTKEKFMALGFFHREGKVL